jgi:hypothetical protein
VDGVEHVDPGRALRRQPDFVQVGVVAVARPDVRDGLIGGVVDDVFALTEADFEDAPLPPGQDRLALVLLDLKIGRRLAGRQRVKPHERAVLFGDHRPRRALALIGGEEQVAGT